jgi:hypothetical protein
MPVTLTPDETLQYLAILLNEWIPAKRTELEALQARYEKSREREAAKPDKAAPSPQGFLAMAFGGQASQPVAEPIQKDGPNIGAIAPIAQNPPEPAQLVTDTTGKSEIPNDELPHLDDDAPSISTTPGDSADDDENLA